MKHVIEGAFDAAWERFEEASARASRYLTGDQQDLFDTARSEAREWFAIADACSRELRG